MKIKPCIAALMLLCSLVARAQQADTVYFQGYDTVAHLTLDKAVVTERLRRPMIETLEGISGTVNVEKIQAIPSFLGNSDPVRFARLLPAIQLNAENDAGIYMQGSDYSHTLVSMEGVPVYGGSHLLGLFSVFNSTHYKSMTYSTTAGQRARLGGIIDMHLQDTLPRKICGDVSAGLISAQGTLQFPTGRNSAMTVSARRSYINLLYGRFLKFAGQPIHYGFTDGNITWYWKASPRDRVWINLFADRDKASFEYSTASSSIEGSWYNALGSVHWNHYWEGGAVLKQTAYATLNGLNAKVDVKYAKGQMPSYIQSYGYRAVLGLGGWEFSADAAYHRVQPQNPVAEGHYNTTNTSSEVLQTGVETKLSAVYSGSIGYWFQYKAGLGGSWYLSPERRSYWGLTPQADLIFNLMDAGKINLRYGIHRQNLFQTGITNVGLPIEFWFLAGDLSDPQWSHNVALAYNAETRNGMWAFSAELYFKRLYNQVEYQGTIMEILNSDYSVSKSLLKGNGYAYGANVMVQKQQGKLTGWVGYAFGRSLRTFDGPLFDGKIYPSDHERLHEVNVVATYDFGRVDVGGTFMAASGTPYTRPESFYVIGDRLICNYGERNGARLPAYVRLDLSANWYFRRHKDGRKNGLNFSIYNVLCRENAVGYGVHARPKDGTYVFKPTAFAIKFMPSVAYFHKF